MILGKRILSPEVANALEEMLVDAVYNGTGENSQVKHFQIAGQTTTAQKPSKKVGMKAIYLHLLVILPISIIALSSTHILIHQKDLFTTEI